MDLPKTVKHLFKWCRYHVLVNPLVSSAVRKMAAYPITDIIIDDEPEDGFDKQKLRWEELLLRTLNVQNFQLEVGLDYYGYGNCLVSVLFPFHKYLICKNCQFTQRIKRLKFGKQWDFRDFKYILVCPSCGKEGEAKVEDMAYRSYRDIKLVRWNPSDVEVDFNPITRTAEYAYTPPEKVKAKILRKNKKYLEEMPSKIIEAVKERRPFIIESQNLYHFKVPTPTLESNDEGWGYPPILPALKDSFYLQIMKKAQEAVMLEHLVPLDVIFPASADANANPYLMINLADWKKRVEAELVKWRFDPNYKPIMPIPLGHQRIGGNGRALMLTQEIRAWSEHIIAGMGVPQEFVFGGLTWSGSSVSMRMLENQFLSYRGMHSHFLQHWLIPMISRFMKWTEVSVHMREFKMADDLQAKQLLLSMNQLKKISDKTLLAEFGKDALDEAKIIEQETRRTLELTKLQMLYQAQIQGEAAQITAKYQAKANDTMMQGQEKAMARQQQMQQSMVPMEGEQPEVQPVQSMNVVDLADAYAKKMSGMDPAEAAGLSRTMEQQMPQLAGLVQKKLATMQGMNAQPLPEQRPPRRQAASI